jgi:hypothetical protein
MRIDASQRIPVGTLRSNEAGRLTKACTVERRETIGRMKLRNLGPEDGPLFPWHWRRLRPRFLAVLMARELWATAVESAPCHWNRFI